MNKLRGTRLATIFTLAIAVFAITHAASAQSSIQGPISSRSGATMTVQIGSGSPPVVVLLTDSTDVGETQGMFHARSKQMPMTALIPGLSVSVNGIYNSVGQLVASKVRFNGNDLKAAMDAQAGLQPTMQKVAANNQAIQQSDAEIAAQQAAMQQQAAALAAQQAQLTAEQQKIAANKAAIAADNKRFGELGEYNILGETTVYFANGKTTVDPQYIQPLIQLAQQAKGITAYIIQVQGYASAVGSAALNQKLSSERAAAVTAVLQQQGQVPLTNMLAPGAMGTTNQVGSDATAEGQAENRRVVVRILQNKGISGT
jgi:OmpA-OmpF porin, OOP family